MQPPSFGIDQGVDGVIHATGCNTVGEVVIDMEHRRKSGRGTLESFVLSSRRSDQHNRPYQNQKDPNPADGSICVLGTHRSFRRVEDTGFERGGDEDESTFKMDLTERQTLTREGVVLPHYDAQRLEQGVIGDGGKILYDLGEEDDFDEEEDEI